MFKTVRGSMTVEASFLMPMIMFLIMGCILAVFYYHDKNILSGAAYETAVVGGTKARETGGVTEGELEQLFRERVKGKCIMFSNVRAAVSVGKDEIEVTAAADRRSMKVSVTKRAAVTEPEKYIRNMRRLK